MLGRTVEPADLTESVPAQGARPAAAAPPLADRLAEVLAEVLEVEHVPPDGDFFADLGADSMLMTRFCARVRKRADLPSVSIKDVYQYPTVGRLAAALAPAAAPAVPEPAGPVAADRSLADRLAGVLSGVLEGAPVPPDSQFFDDLGADSLVMAQFCARIRKDPELPPVSIKDVYQHPTVALLAAALAPAPSPTQQALADVLAEVVGGPVTADSHFFDDLGADSLVMAQFCARVRKHAGLPSVSIKDVYQHPTIRELAGALVPTTPAEVPAAAAPLPSAAPVARRATTTEYLLCGALQVLVFLGYTFLTSYVVMVGFDWISEGGGLLDDYLRSVVVAGGTFLGMCLLPILAKWVLVGRTRPQQIRIWSLAYVRFWTVKTLVRANPLVLFFVGSPLHALYLRALGARIGPGVVIMSKQIPAAPDLLTVGAGTVIRRDVVFTCYRAQAGVIETGTVTIGAGAVIGDAAVLDIDTGVGDGAQLGHRSSLHRGQAVPDGERWHGSPAQRTDVDYRLVEPARCGALRRIVYSVVSLLNVVLVTLPLSLGAVALLTVVFPDIAALLEAGPHAFAEVSFYVTTLEVSTALFFGGIVFALLFVVTVPRLLHVVMRPDKVYPLYGFHYSIHRTIARLTNVKVFGTLFGDSSYIVHYLRGLGYDLGRVVQTGSNFGTGVRHETPYLVSVGSGTMVADGLSVMNADYSSTSFRVSRATIGARSFLGNGIVYPSRARTGDNVMLATKVLIPIEGPVRQDVGLLGSPAFEIPRTVDRDAEFDPITNDLSRHLAAKNRYNLRTIGVFLLVGWLQFTGITLIGLSATELHHDFATTAVAGASLATVAFNLSFGTLVEWVNLRFRPLTPQFCSIYDPYFWWHERYWKLLMSPKILNGTPLKGPMWRLLGVRIGRRVYDDGCDIPERTLVTIGDDATLNGGAWLQCHSQEDGAFKSGRITVGAGVTVGISAWVHYGATVGDGAELVADSFLMKGEEVPPEARWGGNPAVELGPETARPALAAAPTPALPTPRDGEAPIPVQVPVQVPRHRHRAPRRSPSAVPTQRGRHR
ncbi:Pls/PosA family non-ribosomal peptide synthetase [Geodermatophilus sp. CPCC 205761]|uniref:Pls/PosA family non-ribosomal peptide synthetase n=1 Tax=Geodermatophilus sp. CPCC 205761 TaxID=2936597 RepID=UPI003EEFB0D7